ncbi:centriolar satellite-associated tubulin polyglutamylase complex regulator 1 isoform X2 [Phalacrocorax aristotelis]|uniref:centriolar satellite-associated tubulin polyglutamylase complex regulator 1 isoform X2 n=2 Tax=Phalacrocorax aristotelis TaxID=126867 RepID=UPI003F4BCFD0
MCSQPGRVAEQSRALSAANVGRLGNRRKPGGSGGGGKRRRRRRMLSPERLSLPGPEYLAQRHVLTYMEDAVSQLLENREDISQYGIARFFTEYFNSVRQGTHILFREFSFVQATPHNRASFLRTFWRCFRTVGKNGDLLTAQEYHCLLQLLCPDFPMELAQKAARIVLTDDAMDCLMSFSDFLFAFQIQFYYSEFLESVAVIYQDLLAGKNPNTVIVPTSSSGQHRQRQLPDDCSPLDGVEAFLFYQCLESLCDRSKYSCPPSALMKEMLSSAQRMTFYGFLMALSKDQGINRALGALPDKGDLFLDPAMDQELDKFICLFSFRVAQVSGLSVSGPTSSGGDTANLPVRNSPRINSPWKPLHHQQKMDAESEGSNGETDSSEN